ncbi:hypothetical protein [Lederbergia galactosidilytica]|uniref:hypothetical protein n=1 Tax=Lederbergia galactosidilytica TaxID=217031 RepID=UPI000FFE7472|nr:hypothetical protein [Lederbergia galactosidilytica]
MVKRLHQDLIVRLNCWFMVGASTSVTAIHNHSVLQLMEGIQKVVPYQAIMGEFITALQLSLKYFEAFVKPRQTQRI